MNDIFSTPEILDITEVEKTKLHEEEETKRTLIEEKECTIRERNQNRLKKWTDSGFLFAISFVTITTLAVIAYYVSMRYQAAIPCTESLQVVWTNDTPKLCSVGAKIETKPANTMGGIEVRCICK